MDDWSLISTDATVLVGQARVEAEILITGSADIPDRERLGFTFSSNVPQAIPSLPDLGSYVWAKGRGAFIFATDGSVFDASVYEGAPLNFDNALPVDTFGTEWYQTPEQYAVTDEGVVEFPGNLSSGRLSINLDGGSLDNFTVITRADITGGTYRARLLSPSQSAFALRNGSGPQTWDFRGTPGSTILDLTVGTNIAGELNSCEIYDQSDILTQPFDVYFFWGQSNMVCADGADTVTEGDGFISPRVLYAPLTSLGSYGAVQHVPMTVATPMQFAGHDNVDILNASNRGVSPAHAFLKEMDEVTEEGRTILGVCLAVSGSGLTDEDAIWNANGTNPIAWNAALAQITAVMAALPAGSEVRAFVASHGESDAGPDMSDYPPALQELREGFDAALGRVGTPWVMIAPPEDATRAYQDVFVETIYDLDMRSGSATALDRFVVSPRPVGYMIDGDETHVTNAGQRIAGKWAAESYLTAYRAGWFDL